MLSMLLGLLPKYFCPKFKLFEVNPVSLHNPLVAKDRGRTEEMNFWNNRTCVGNNEIMQPVSCVLNDEGAPAGHGVFCLVNYVDPGLM